MLAFVFVVLAVAVRLGVAAKVFALPFHFTPVGASLLFFGAKMPRKLAWIPLTLFIATDIILCKAIYHYPVAPDVAVSWVWYAVALGIGSVLLKKSDNLGRVAGASLISSVLFFLVSNGATWAAWDMYPKTLGGLWMSYVAGLPFFRNTALSDLIFSVAFFSIPVAIELFRPKAVRERA